MKHTKHIHGVNNLVQEINNIVQHRQECQTMEYDVQFICCSCKITDTERKCIIRKHRQNHMYDSMAPLAKKRFLENKKSIQLWTLSMYNQILQMKHKLYRIPTGGRLTSWLFTRAINLNSGLLRTIPYSSRLENCTQGTPDVKSSGLNHSATLPPFTANTKPE